MKLTASLTGSERRLVLALSIAAACVLTLTTSFNYLLVPISKEFTPSEPQLALLRQAPIVAALLVVFPAGALGARIGEKRFAFWCVITFAVGAVIVAVAPVVQVVILGVVVANIGRAALFIVGLGYMASVVSGKDGRAAAFAVYSMVLPVTFLTMPILAGLVINLGGWRWVAVICAAFGVVGAFLIHRLVPGRPGRGGVGEMWTPALAGLFFVLLVQALQWTGNEGLTSPRSIAYALAAAGVLGVLAVLMRRLAQPSLSLAPLRDGGFALLLILLLLFCFANLWFYTTLAFEYVYGLSSLQTALALIPAQVAGLCGAVLAGRLIQLKGIAVAGSLLMAGVAVCLGLSSVARVDSPIWLPMAIVAAYALASAGAGVALTNAIMNTAPRGSEGGAAAFRGAFSNLGSAVSVTFMTMIVTTAVHHSLLTRARRDGLNLSSEVLSEVSRALRQGQSTLSASQTYSLPLETVQVVDTIHFESLMTGYRTHGWVGGGVTLIVAAAFYLVVRRQERQRACSRGEAGDSAAT